MVIKGFRFYVVFVIFIVYSVGLSNASDSFSNLKSEQQKADFERTFFSQIKLIESQNVGCLLDKELCDNSERCLDDNLFGTCVAAYDDSMYFTYRLPRSTVSELKAVLAMLVAGNYTWRHVYSQCCVRATLLSSSMELPVDLSVCNVFANLRQSDLTAQQQQQQQQQQEQAEAGVKAFGSAAADMANWLPVMEAAAAAAAGGGGGGAGGSPHSSTGSWTEDPIPTDMDITTGHLILNYMEEYLNNKEKLEQEWASLCSYEAEQSASLAGATAENAAKNRFQDLLPYDHTRVTLKKYDDSPSDYINASYICDSDPKVKSYVLTQGPTESTADDFWQMVWECGAITIVNLTQAKSPSGSQDFCATYWPSEGPRLFKSKFEVHLVSEHVWCEDFIVRNFYLKSLPSGEARTVTMFHFLSWEEAGLPPTAKALLDFRRKVNKSYKGRSTPVIIHCSDGCGRSGTYCLLDMSLNRINKGVKEIDLAASLEHLRDQRPGLVKTKDQFEFVVEAIAEEVNNVLKTLPQ